MGLAQSAEGSTATTEAPSGPGLAATAVADAKHTMETSDSYAEAINRQASSRMGVSQALMQNIIGGGFMLVIGIIMLGFLFDLDLVSNFSGPFADQLNTVETVMGAAIVFAVLGVLAMAGVYAYSMFQTGR